MVVVGIEYDFGLVIVGCQCLGQYGEVVSEQFVLIF